MERRAHYRVAAGDVPRVHVTVRTSNGAVVTGDPTNVSVDGAALRFALSESDRTAGPVFEIGEQVELQFALPARDNPVLVRAMVIHRTDENAARHYGFHFTDRAQLDSQLTPALFRLFNRRASDRVKPAPGSLDVTLDPGAGRSTVVAQLLDISVGGMGLRAPRAVESALATADRVRVYLSLPTQEARLDLVVRIRNRSLVGSDVRYGVEYDRERTQNLEHQLEAINAFVTDRQLAERSQPEATP